MNKSICHPQDKGGNNMACANNCRGVDPNSVIIGGSAVLAAAAVSGTSFLFPAAAVGIGGPAALGVGAAAMMMMRTNGCPRGLCVVSPMPVSISS
jgi:hypothetical protein